LPFHGSTATMFYVSFPLTLPSASPVNQSKLTCCHFCRNS